MVQLLKFGNRYVISPILYWPCGYLTMLGFKLTYVGKGGSEVLWYIPRSFYIEKLRKHSYPDSKVHGANMGPI